MINPNPGDNQCDHGQLKRQCLTCELLDEIERLKEKLAAYDEIYLRGCECDLDDACRFVKERDEARSEVCSLWSHTPLKPTHNSKDIAKERGWDYLFESEK